MSGTQEGSEFGGHEGGSDAPTRRAPPVDPWDSDEPFPSDDRPDIDVWKFVSDMPSSPFPGEETKNNLRNAPIFIQNLAGFLDKQNSTSPVVGELRRVLDENAEKYLSGRQRLFSLINKFHSIHNSYNGAPVLTLDHIRPLVIEHDALNRKILKEIVDVTSKSADPISSAVKDMMMREGRLESDFIVTEKDFSFFPNDWPDTIRRDVLRSRLKDEKIWDWETNSYVDRLRPEIECLDEFNRIFGVSAGATMTGLGIGAGALDEEHSDDIHAEYLERELGGDIGEGHEADGPVKAPLEGETQAPGEVEAQPNPSTEEGPQTGDVNVDALLSDGAAPETTIAGDTGASSPKEGLLGEPDPLGEFTPIGYGPYDMLVAALWEARGDRRREVSEELRALAQERERLLRKMNDADTNEKMKINAAAGGGGGGGGGGIGLGGLFSGIGSIGSAVAGKITGGSDRKLRDVERKMSGLFAFRDVALDRQFRRLIESAGMSIMAHQAMASGVQNINNTLANDQEGAYFIKKFNKTAEGLGATREQLWDRIHDATDNDAAVAGLRSMADDISQKPEFSERMQRVGAAAEAFNINSQKFASHMEMAKKAGIKMDGINQGMVDALSSLDCPDCMLAKPGGSRLDKAKKMFEDMAKAFLAALTSVVAALGVRRAFGK